MNANRIMLDQGSEEWKQWRKGKISASKVAAILGICPYRSCLMLYEEEMGLREPQASNPHMQRGLDVEDQVRQWFFDQYRIEVQPCVLQSKENPLFIASLDGINSINTCIVEIKNNNKEYHEMAQSGKLPEHHRAQVQFQMFVSGLDVCYYISHRQGDYALVVVQRDQAYIDDMIPKVLDFKRRLDEFDPPPATDRDYEDLSSDMILHDLMAQYDNDTRIAKELLDRAERLKKDVIERIGNKNAKGTNWKVSRYETQGRVDYQAIVTDLCPDVDLEKYRKKGSYSYRITVQ